jgi:hypothetical protein
MEVAQNVLLFCYLSFMFVGLPAAVIMMRRKAAKHKRDDEAFTKLAPQVGLVQSGLSNNADYALFYDAFTLSGDKPIWQTTTEPQIYLNPYRQYGAELLVKGNYNLPSVKLEAKKNKTRIHRRWGNKLPMKRIKLEGNFNNYFAVYCEVGQEIIALQIFSPEIMQQMIDSQIYYDVQIQGAAIMLTTDVEVWNLFFVQKFLAHAKTLDGLIRATMKVTRPRVK